MSAQNSPENPETAEQQSKSEKEVTLESIQLWAEELAHHLEIEETEIEIDELLKLAGTAAHTVVRPAAPITTFIIGYVTGLAEGSGQADYATARKAATRVAETLLERRAGAVG